MIVYFWTNCGQAYIHASGIIRESVRSISVKMDDGSRQNILKKDIISIEEVN